MVTLQKWCRLPRFLRAIAVFIAIVCGSTVLIATPAQARIPPPGPKDGAIGVEGNITKAPPSRGATITSPVNGQHFRSIPITVTGYCPNGLLVKIFDNDIFVGAVMCKNNSYAIRIQLFSGRNDLVARVFDSLEQEGPPSNRVSVTFDDAQFAQFGSHMAITSPYARRGALPDQQLTWPIVISGGAGPYALSIDWGDGSSPDLLSRQFGGEVVLKHTYAASGVYTVFIKGADKNGTEAFLQVVAIISGNTSTNKAGTNSTTNKGGSNKVLWLPAVLVLILLPLSFWLGQRYELAALRKRIERESQV